MLRHLRTVAAAAAAFALALAASAASAQDKVKVGMFPVSSSLPFYVALDRGYFKEVNIEPEVTRLMGGPSNVAALTIFTLSGSVLWRLAIPMGIANIAGASLGSRLVLRRGDGLVRVTVLCVLTALVLKLLYDLWQAR